MCCPALFLEIAVLASAWQAAQLALLPTFLLVHSASEILRCLRTHLGNSVMRSGALSGDTPRSAGAVALTAGVGGVGQQVTADALGGCRVDAGIVSRF